VEEVIDHTKQDFHVFLLDLTGLEAAVQISDACIINLLKLWFGS